MNNKDRLYIISFYILKFIVNVFPDFLLNKFTNLVAFIVFKLNKKHRKIISLNLQICFPDKDEKWRKTTSLNIYKNYAKFGIDFIKNQNTTKEKILKKINFENIETINNALKEKKTIILTTAHYGNWELCALAYAAKFGAISVVGRALDSKIMDKILSKNRTQLNMQLINKTNGLKKMLQALKNQRTLGLLTDQDASENESIKIEFFNQEVNYINAASIIAKKTNAILIPAYIYQNNENTYNIKIYQGLDAKNHSIEELTKYQAKTCEEMIKFKPDEYFFFHKRFKKNMEYK